MEFVYLGGALFFGLLFVMLAANIVLIYARATHKRRLAVQVVKSTRQFAPYFRLDTSERPVRKKAA